MKTCAECDQKHYAKGLCRLHYYRTPYWVEKLAAKYLAQRDARIVAARTSYHANKAKRRLTAKRWADENSQKMREYRAEWSRKNPEAMKATAATRRAKLAGCAGSHTAAEVRGVLGLQKGRCAVCRADLSDGYHKDHIQPIARGGDNFIANIQLLCAQCNWRKGAKDPVEFMRSLGRLL